MPMQKVWFTVSTKDWLNWESNVILEKLNGRARYVGSTTEIEEQML